MASYKLRCDTPEGDGSGIKAGLSPSPLGDDPGGGFPTNYIDHPLVAVNCLAYPKMSILQSRLDRVGDLPREGSTPLPPSQHDHPPPLPTPASPFELDNRTCSFLLVSLDLALSLWPEGVELLVNR
jgi:hypothetical protein